MSRKLPTTDLAYNALIDMRNEARGVLLAALEDFNRATDAAESLYVLRLPTYKLTERK
jgi:hypothetical protein